MNIQYPRKWKRNRRARTIQRAWRKRRYKKYNKNTCKKQLKKLKKIVYNNINPGWKDTYQAPTAVGAGGEITGDFCGLENIAQGTNHDDRIGNKIVVKQIHFKGNIQVARGDIYNEIRQIIFSTPDVCTTDPPAIQDILETGDLYSFYKKNSKIKFKIHYDKTWQMSNPYSEVGTVTPVGLNGMCYPNYIHWEIKLKFPKGHPIWYGNASVGSPTKGAFFLLRISDSLSAIPSGHPTVANYCRMLYDL